MYYYMQGVDTESLLGFKYIEKVANENEAKAYIEERHSEYDIEDFREVSIDEAIELEKELLLDTILYSTTYRKKNYDNEKEKQLDIFKTAQQKMEIFTSLLGHGFKKVGVRKFIDVVDYIVHAETSTEVDAMLDELWKIENNRRNDYANK